MNFNNCTQWVNTNKKIKTLSSFHNFPHVFCIHPSSSSHHHNHCFNFYHHSLVLLFLEFSVNVVLQYDIYFCVWLLLFSMIFLRFIHVVAYVICFFFIAEYYSVVWICLISLSHSAIGGHAANTIGGITSFVDSSINT